MSKYSIYIIFGVCALVFLVIQLNNRKRSKQRKSKKFMDGYDRKKNEK
ncbi:uncharacterized membrane protein YuzA (DUF378 family) [Saonia flava]|uniref:Uncharacterized membrane protein YuzA (DUF378 family) n=1 Tax=Saonia flava TaxID=523696 RepID=A0A846QVP3_9FLAO|nr:hypothetical protein [Saonia flava]NJB72371.1 uncharacterized membrane protein YuzA (DUF378 family) [Saonia flava]